VSHCDQALSLATCNFCVDWTTQTYIQLLSPMSGSTRTAIEFNHESSQPEAQSPQPKGAAVTDANTPQHSAGPSDAQQLAGTSSQPTQQSFKSAAQAQTQTPSKTPSRDLASSEVEAELDAALDTLPAYAREAALKAHIVALNEQLTEQEALIFMLRCEVPLGREEDTPPAHPSQSQPSSAPADAAGASDGVPAWAQTLLQGAAAREAKQHSDDVASGKLLPVMEQLLEELRQHRANAPAGSPAGGGVSLGGFYRGGSFAFDGNAREESDVDVRSVMVDEQAGGGVPASSIPAFMPASPPKLLEVDSVTAHRYFSGESRAVQPGPGSINGIPGVGPLMGALQATQARVTQLQSGLGNACRIWGAHKQQVDESIGHLQIATSTAQAIAKKMQLQAVALQDTQQRINEAVDSSAHPSAQLDLSEVLAVAARAASAAAAAKSAAGTAATQASRAATDARAAAADTGRKLLSLQSDTAQGFSDTTDSLLKLRHGVLALNKRVAAVLELLQQQQVGDDAMYNKRYVYTTDREAKAQRQAAGMSEPPSPQLIPMAGVSNAAARHALALASPPSGGVVQHMMSPSQAAEQQEVSSAVQIPPHLRRGGGGTSLMDSQLARMLEVIHTDVRNLAKVVHNKKQAQRTAGVYTGANVDTPPRHPTAGTRGGFSTSAGAAARNANLASLDTSGGGHMDSGRPMGASPAHSVGSTGSVSSAQALEESMLQHAQFSWTLRAATAPSGKLEPSPRSTKSAEGRGFRDGPTTSSGGSVPGAGTGGTTLPPASSAAPGGGSD